MKKYSALQQISLWWYRTFDINGFIFYSLKTFGKLYRFTFYIFLTLGIFAFMFFIGKIININNLVVEEELVAIINNLCYFILITGTLLTGLIVSYEFIIEEDMDNYLMQRRSQKDAIMLNKKQWWRLRNMHFLVRLAIYLILYLILRYVLIKTSLLAFVDTYQYVTQIQFNNFTKELDNLIQYLTAIYFTLAIALDILVVKNRSSIK